jgi:DNA-binding NtrC family response regulator
VIRIDIPSLVERREDIPLLVDHFITTYNRMHDREVAGLTPEAFSLIMNYHFPGNIRELQNILEHAFVLCPSGMIKPQHLPPYLSRESLRETDDGGMNLKEAERRLIEKALRKYQGNRNRAAEALGINPSTLYRKIRQYGINPQERDGRGLRFR